MHHTALSRAALALLALLLTPLAGCGDAEEATAPAATDSCACPDGVCAEGECVLQLIMDPGCEVSWGEANIFFGDLSGTAEPVGTLLPDQPWTTCEPFAAPTATQAAEPFEFIVETADQRMAVGSTSAGKTFQCAGSEPFVFTVTCF